MPQSYEGPEQKVSYSEAEQLGDRKLRLVPQPGKPSPRKRDLGARLKAILMGRFQARGLANEEARMQAELCLGFSLEDRAHDPPSPGKIVAIR